MDSTKFYFSEKYASNYLVVFINIKQKMPLLMNDIDIFAILANKLINNIF